VALTETVLGIALTQVSNGVQIALTVFVIVFPLLVAGGFFFILWHRAYVFYAPSEYGNVDPEQFMSAMRAAPIVAEQVELARSVGADPNNLEARFSLIDAMADDVECQTIILMHDQHLELPRSCPYVFRYKGGRGGTGQTGGGLGGRDRMVGTGLLRTVAGGEVYSLTDEGHSFAKWLVAKGRKCDFFWTPKGGWGELEPNSIEAKWVEEQSGRFEGF